MNKINDRNSPIVVLGPSVGATQRVRALMPNNVRYLRELVRSLASRPELELVEGPRQPAKTAVLPRPLN